MYGSKLKKIVRDLLLQFDINSVPVDVESIATQIGAEIRREDFDEDLSGFALQKNGSKFIGINSTEGHERQRFTIAHELGHLILHKQDNVNYDAGVGLVLLREAHSVRGSDIKEVEANRFAAELLMPEQIIRQDLSGHGDIDLMSDESKTGDFISEMATKYDVSYQAMQIRLTALYFS